MNKYANAKFITSAAGPQQFLKTDKPVIAISGRSNVGKSSFINLLAGRKQLARVSKEPGRTRLINYFDYGGFILADLPGYGYAKVSKEEKLKWARLLDEFFAEEGHICHVLALVDCRHEPTADDIQMVEFLYSKIIPFTVIATKADKISKAEGARSKIRIAAALKCGADDVILTSSQKRTGLESVIKRIQNVITYGTRRNNRGGAHNFYRPQLQVLHEGGNRLFLCVYYSGNPLIPAYYSPFDNL